MGSNILQEKAVEHEKAIRRTAIGKRWLKGLTAAVMVAGASGVLLFLPPFSIWPLYPVTLSVHSWLGLLAAIPFLSALFIHAWRRLRNRRLMWTGLAFSLCFFMVLGTGIGRLLQIQLPAWWLVLHLLSGSLTIMFGLLHGARVRLDR